MLKILLTLTVLLVGPNLALAQGWTVSLKADPLGPPKFLAVDKSAQTFLLFEQKSPLQVAQKYPCTTGQAAGDKVREGDKRTPEGVYFIQGRKSGGLDYSLYGDLAFTLDYPNPVDVINGKTGHGIWIHGRGYEITPNESLGCVALNSGDIKAVESKLEKRMPVIIANEVLYTSDAPASSEDAKQVTELTQAWAKAWRAKSDEFFAFHDEAKFSISSGEPFSNFKQHKKQLFASLPWLHLVIDDVRAVPGPDYWVTYFRQYYRSPSLTSEGVKRLYWQKNKAGKWVIVGMEMEEGSIGLEAKYLASLNKDLSGLVEAWRAAWEKGKVQDYIAFYADNAVQGDRRGKQAIKDQKQTLWTTDKAPKKVSFKDVRVAVHQDGVLVEFVQEYASKDGLSDRGRKRLIFAPRGDSWSIVSEDWTRL